MKIRLSPQKMTLIWLQSHFVYDPRNVKLHVFSSPHAETSKEQTDNQKDHEALSVGLSLFLVVFLSFFFYSYVLADQAECGRKSGFFPCSWILQYVFKITVFTWNWNDIKIPSFCLFFLMEAKNSTLSTLSWLLFSPSPLSEKSFKGSVIYSHEKKKKHGIESLPLSEKVNVTLELTLLCELFHNFLMVIHFFWGTSWYFTC